MSTKDVGARAASLITQPNFRNPQAPGFWAYSAGDDFYEMLINAHRELSDAQSAQLNARLILLLANHVGDLGVLREALEAARKGV